MGQAAYASSVNEMQIIMIPMARRSKRDFTFISPVREVISHKTPIEAEMFPLSQNSIIREDLELGFYNESLE